MPNPKISRRAAGLQPSATLAVAARAGQLRAQGREIFDLSAGEPDFPPPKAVRETVAKLVAESPMPYAPAPGLPALREAAAATFAKVHGCAVEAADVLVSCGAKHSLANLFLATIDEGDEVIIPAPYWVSYPAQVGLAGGTAVIAETRAEEHYRLQPDALRELVNERTRYLLINSPQNPTGSSYDLASLQALGRVLAEQAPHVTLLCDDIYRRLTYDGAAHVSAVSALAGIHDKVVVVDGVSKAFAMTGYRIGFLWAPRPVIAAASKIQAQMTSGATTSSQHAALAALTAPGVDDEVERMRVTFSARRDRVLWGLGGIEGFSVLPPSGAFYAFADARAHAGPGKRHKDDIELATWLLEEHSVATVPGTAFGAPGHLRLSYATSEAVLDAAIERIAAALSGA